MNDGLHGALTRLQILNQQGCGIDIQHLCFCSIQFQRLVNYSACIPDNVLAEGWLKVFYSTRTLETVVLHYSIKSKVSFNAFSVFLITHYTLKAHRSRVIIPSEPLLSPVLLSLSGGRLLELPGR